MLTNIKAALFDLDGTIVDSMGIWRQIDIEYLDRFGIPLPEDLQSQIEGMSFHQTAVYMKKLFSIPDSVEVMTNDWNQMALHKYRYEVKLKPGAYEFLSYLKKHGIKMAIATSNSRELAEAVLNAHHILEFFDSIITGSDIINGKPAPDVYLASAAAVNVEPQNCIVFEDIVPGIMAGHNAGMKVCAIEDAYSADKREQKREMANYYIQDYNELLSHLS